jgi:hypothetical protein
VSLLVIMVQVGLQQAKHIFCFCFLKLAGNLQAKSCCCDLYSVSLNGSWNKKA